VPNGNVPETKPFRRADSPAGRQDVELLCTNIVIHDALFSTAALRANAAPDQPGF
jgi:hypothetical protein